MGRSLRILLALAVLAAVIAVGALTRDALGLEARPGSVRELVRATGPWGPLVFVGVVVFRNALLIPSQVLMIAAGVVFGAALGTLYGALGLLGSAVLYFGFTRWLGREAVIARASPRVRAVLDVLGERPGAFFVGAATAYPVGLLGAYWTAAAVTGMAWLSFLVAVFLGALVRAGAYVLVGSALIEADPARLALAGLALLLLFALPLLHPGVRAWVRRIRAAGALAADTARREGEGR